MKTIITLLILSFSGLALAQMPGSISGKVFNAAGRETLPNAHIVINIRGTVAGTVSDLNGQFSMKAVPPGLYELEIRYTGFESRIIRGIRVNPGEITFIGDVFLQEGISIGGVDIVEQKTDLINIDDPSKLRLDGKKLKELPQNRDISAMLEYISSSIYVNEDSRKIQVRGSRSGDAIYIIDGIKVRGGDLSVPGGAIGSMTVYTGGVPAAYGDFTGGVVIIETKSYFDWVVEQRMKEYARQQALTQVE